METKTTVIIPVHTTETIDYFKKAIQSLIFQDVKPEKVLVVSSSSVFNDYNTFDYGDIKEIVTVLENNGNTDFCSQINFGADNVTTEYFSVLETDDEYSKIWFRNVTKYIQSFPNVDMFLPIVLDVSVEGKFIHFSNEPVWAKDFSDELGFLDNNSLLHFPNFQIAGMVIKTNTFREIGGLKPTVKLYFGYELLLRLTHYDKKVMTLPKLGYKKTNMRPDSLFDKYYNGSPEEKLDPTEARFWYNTAKKEYYFKTDRKITYSENSEV
jgi:hypothetical protein